MQCFSGTHAITCALFGVLRPGDTMLACSGPPYDTLDEVIGTRAPMTVSLRASEKVKVGPRVIFCSAIGRPAYRSIAHSLQEDEFLDEMVDLTADMSLFLCF